VSQRTCHFAWPGAPHDHVMLQARQADRVFRHFPRQLSARQCYSSSLPGNAKDRRSTAAGQASALKITQKPDRLPEPTSRAGDRHKPAGKLSSISKFENWTLLVPLRIFSWKVSSSGKLPIGNAESYQQTPTLTHVSTALAALPIVAGNGAKV